MVRRLRDVRVGERVDSRRVSRLGRHRHVALIGRDGNGVQHHAEEHGRERAKSHVRCRKDDQQDVTGEMDRAVRSVGPVCTKSRVQDHLEKQRRHHERWATERHVEDS